MKLKNFFLVGLLVGAMLLSACNFTAPSGDDLTETAAPTETEVSETPAPTETEVTETPEPTETEVTETPEPTETEVTETPEATETEEGVRAGCGDKTNTPPVAGKIATVFNVTEEEVMGYFCDGFGFGEIKNAYALALASGKDVAELFDMKAGGMGWGQIKNQLGIKPGKGGKPCWKTTEGQNDPTCVKPGKKGGKPEGAGNKGGGKKGGSDDGGD